MEAIEGYQYYLQLSGKYLIDNPLELPDPDKYLLLAGEFEFGKEVKDTKKEHYIINVSPVRLKMESGSRVLQGKIKSKASVRLRAALWHKYQELNLPDDGFDDWYDTQTNKIILNLDAILTLTNE